MQQAASTIRSWALFTFFLANVAACNALKAPASLSWDLKSYQILDILHSTRRQLQQAQPPALSDLGAVSDAFNPQVFAQV